MGGAHRLDLLHDVVGKCGDPRPGHVDMQGQGFRRRGQPAVEMVDFLIGAQALVVVVDQIEGDTDAILNNPEVRSVYLGEHFTR